MINPIELKMRQRVVKAFTDADYADIILRRPTKVKTPRGTFVEGPDIIIPPQRVRLIVSKRRYNTALVNSEAGNVEKYPYNLIGDANMDIEENDHFTHLGEHFKVSSIEHDREERTLVALEYYGEKHPMPS